MATSKDHTVELYILISFFPGTCRVGEVMVKGLSYGSDTFNLIEPLAYSMTVGLQHGAGFADHYGKHFQSDGASFTASLREAIEDAIRYCERAHRPKAYRPGPLDFTTPTELRYVPSFV